MSQAPIALPAGFEALQPYVTPWSTLDEKGLIKAAHAASVDELRPFYEAGVAVFPKILTYLHGRAIGSLTAEEATLFALALALLEVSSVFEVYHGAPPAHLADVSEIVREVQLVAS